MPVPGRRAASATSGLVPSVRERGNFLGGLLGHIDALTVLGAPTVNSYKRLADRGQWAATSERFGFDDRSCVFRVPAPGRIEVRHDDAAANPYLTLTGMLAAGRDGMRRCLDPGIPSDEARSRVAGRIPASLEAALAAFSSERRGSRLAPPPGSGGIRSAPPRRAGALRQPGVSVGTGILLGALAMTIPRNPSISPPRQLHYRRCGAPTNSNARSRDALQPAPYIGMRIVERGLRAEVLAVT